jgi:hypothetical protein
MSSVAKAKLGTFHSIETLEKCLPQEMLRLRSINTTFAVILGVMMVCLACEVVPFQERIFQLLNCRYSLCLGKNSFGDGQDGWHAIRVVLCSNV